MSRLAKKPLKIPAGVEVVRRDNILSIKGKLGAVEHDVTGVNVDIQDGSIQVLKQGSTNSALTGTTRKLLGNWVKGVSEGFQRKLKLEGVGYRAKIEKGNLELSLGFSHPVIYEIPQGIKIEVLNSVEIIITGMDLERVGQVGADIREFRPPECYKGKGVRYWDEKPHLKEAKKKK